MNSALLDPDQMFVFFAQISEENLRKPAGKNAIFLLFFLKIWSGYSSWQQSQLDT